MLRKPILFIFTLLLIITAAKSQDNVLYLSLKQCLKTSLESSQSIINAKLEKDKSSYQKEEVWSTMYPHIEGFGTYDNYVKLPVTMIPGDIFGQPGTTIPVSLAMKHNLSGGVKFTQIIYNQTVLTSLSLSEKIKEISSLNLDRSKNNIIYEIARLYFLVKATEAQRIIFMENITRMDRLLKISGSQLETGFIRPVDYDRIKVTRENINTELSNIDILSTQQKQMLLYTIGVKHSSKIELTDSLKAPLFDQNTLPDSNTHLHPDVVFWNKQKELAQLNKSLVNSGYYPSLALYGQYFYQGQREKFDFLKAGEDKFFKVGIIGLSLSIPIFDGFQKNAKSNQSEADYLVAENNYEFSTRFLRIEYENALKKYRSNLEAEKRQVDNTQSSENLYGKMLLQYEQGIATLTDLLNTENILSETRLILLNATLNLRLAELDLLKATDNLKLIINK